MFFPIKTSRRELIAILLQIASFVLLARSYYLSSNTGVMLGDVLFLFAILIGKPETDIITYTTLIPLTGLMPEGFFRVNICLFISIAKLFVAGKKNRTDMMLISLIYMSLSYIYFNAGSSYVTLLFFMLFCIVYAYRVDYNRINYHLLTLMAVLSSLGILVLILISSSSLDVYMEATNEQFKMGEENRELGGAMAVSLYTCMGTAAAFVLMKTHQGILRYGAIASLLFFLLMGLFALSRTFFTSLGLALIISIPRMKSAGANSIGKRIYPIIAITIAFVIGGYYIYNMLGDGMLQMVDKLDSIFHGGTGSRSKIWMSSINYLLTHPIDLLVGQGMYTYSTVLSNKEYAFWGYGCHNLYLDALMSFGVLGFMIFFTLLKNAYERINNLPNATILPSKGFYLFPLVIFFACNLAQGSFRDTSTYILPLAIVLITYGSYKTAKSE